MKHPLLLTTVLAGIAGTLVSQQHHTPITERTRSEAVFLWAYQTGYSIQGEGDSRFYYAGAKVYTSSSSAGAPMFPRSPATNLVEIAEATAQLLSLGYSIKTSDNGLQVIATKP